MSEFTMGARLVLEDSFSSQLRSTITATEGFRSASMSAATATSTLGNRQTQVRTAMSQTAQATREAETAAERYGGAAEGLSGKLFNLKNAAMAVVTGAAMKKGFDWLVSGNADMETYQNTLSVVLGSQEKAVDQLQWATTFAAQTPFEIPQIVEATTKMASYGMEAKDTLGIVGDMASVMGKDLMQAVEAVADSQTGEVERLKEFGITKDQIAAQATAMGKAAIDSKGSISDQKAFNAALFAIMEKRFKGGMDLQSKTFKGMLSNASDFVSGIGRKLGQPIFDGFKAQLGNVLDVLNTLQANGAIDTWINNIQQGFAAFGNVLAIVLPPLIQFSPVILGLIAGFMAYQKTVVIIAAVTKMWAAAQGILDAVMAANPIGLVVAAIVALVGVLIWAWNTFPQFRAVVLDAFSAISAWVTANWPIIRDTLVGVWNTIYATCAPIVQFLWQIILTAFTAISTWVTTNWPIIQNAIVAAWNYVYAAVAPIVTSIFSSILNAFNAVMGWVQTYWPQIQTIITVVMAAIGAVIEVAWAYYSAYIGAAIQIIWSVIQNGFDLIVAIMTGVWGMISAVIQTAWGVISNIVAAAINILTGNFSAAGENILNIFRSMGDGIINFFGSLGTMLYNSGAAIMRTLADGIKAAASAPFEAVKGAFSKIREMLPFSDAHEGPFSQLTLSGKRIMSTMATGVSDGADSLHAAVNNAFKDTDISASATINPAGNVKSSGVVKSTSIDTLVGELHIHKVEGDDEDSLADKIINKLHEKLTAAADIASNADMEVLL